MKAPMKALTIRQPEASLCVTERPCVCWAGDQSHFKAGPLNHCCLCDDTGEREPFKTIETRGWRAPRSLIGQRIAIHAAVKPLRLPKFRPLTAEQQALHELWELVHDDLCDCGQTARICLTRGLCSLARGAVVGTAVLANCVPMVEFDENGVRDSQIHGGDHLCIDGSTLMLFTDADDMEGEDVSDQLPFGRFEPGGWAWLLADAERFVDPVPEPGRPYIWDWEVPT